jgi:hypothetical protein
MALLAPLLTLAHGLIRNRDEWREQILEDISQVRLDLDRDGYAWRERDLATINGAIPRDTTSVSSSRWRKY